MAYLLHVDDVRLCVSILRWLSITQVMVIIADAIDAEARCDNGSGRVLRVLIRRPLLLLILFMSWVFVIGPAG